MSIAGHSINTVIKLQKVSVGPFLLQNTHKSGTNTHFQATLA